MLTYHTDKINLMELPPQQRLWVYNGLDCCLTEEIRRVIEPQLSPEQKLLYNFELGLQAPALEMSMRGILIDISERNRWVAELEKQIAGMEENLNTLTNEVWGKDLNIASPKQMKDFFFGALGIPKLYNYAKGKRTVSLNRNNLEKLLVRYDAKIFVKFTLRLRDLRKTIGVLKSAVDSDNRMRTEYVVAGTETGRWASRANAHGSGTNLQNIAEKLRSIFIANPGYKLAYIDLEQAESRAVAYLSEDENYINACESGDLHSTVSEMVWPGGDPKEIYYREFTRRYMCKRLGHGTNYWGKAPGMAKQTHIDKDVVVAFQRDYFEAFPGIPEWQQATITEVQTTGQLTSPLGATRKFWGRLDDDATFREAIAHVPQGMIGHILNLGMWRLWRYGKHSRLLAQIHDAVLIMYKEADEAIALEEATKAINVTVPVKGRALTVPCAFEGV